ncbi:MAG TPA: response regulator transcription factor [Gaiellaceae bacterium]|jgi:DNA-binding response OmpR family regulator|nr:response regulator transcription factor [Gaiellaceae bacterium]
MTASRILVVDDDDDIRGLLRTLLERAGHQVTEAPDGRAGLRELYAGSPDLVILDVAMPRLDGWATLERIREVSDVPVLMLTARDAEVERVRGLMGGADDYVVKPFGRQELVARVDVLLRRPRSGAAEETYADARLSISFAQRAVRYDEREVALTRLEYRLLCAFVQHANQVLSQDQLRELVWGDNLATSRDEVKLYVGYLRRKLSPDAPQATPIETVRGFGYRYRPPA